MQEKALTRRPGFRRWFWVQWGLELAILVSWGITGGVRKVQNVGHYELAVGGLILLVLLSACLLAKGENDASHQSGIRQRLLIINHYGQVIFLIPTVTMMLQWLIQMLLTAGVNGTVLMVGGLVLSMVMYVPISLFALGRVRALVGRILLVILVMFNIVFTGARLTEIPHLTTAHWLVTVANSGIVGALGFAFTMGLVMSQWGYRLPSFGWSKTVDWRVVSVLIVSTLGYVFYNTFSTGTTWGTALTTFDFHLSAPTIDMFLNGLEPGIAEELLFRFVVLTLLLRAFQKVSHGVFWAVLTSALLFGLFHVPNLAVQSVSATASQAVTSVAIGLLWASIYLYTRAFWWPMLFHASVDALGFMSSGTQVMDSLTPFDWGQTIILIVIFSGLAIFLLTGTRGQNVHRNVSLMIGDVKHD
ncbi:CPBP family intramembrane glutamic endopeptidase [Furfurilactobacillus sp. WILCCON 0119]